MTRVSIGRCSRRGAALAARARRAGDRPRPASTAPPPCGHSAREGAFIDLTGQWVSVVTEDWRWRMVTPPKGDTASVPLNPAGRKVADAWDLAADRARGDLCKAFGPPSLIRQPGRLRIRWENDNTLLLEFDAGTQTRRFHFDDRRRPARDRCRGSRRRGGSGSRRIAASSAAAVARARRLARGRDHESARRLSAPQRRALQRTYGRQGILRQLHAAGRRHVADRDDGRATTPST